MLKCRLATTNLRCLGTYLVTVLMLYRLIEAYVIVGATILVICLIYILLSFVRIEYMSIHCT